MRWVAGTLEHGLETVGRADGARRPCHLGAKPCLSAHLSGLAAGGLAGLDSGFGAAFESPAGFDELSPDFIDSPPGFDEELADFEVSPPELAAAFGLTPEDLNLELGPLGKLLE